MTTKAQVEAQTPRRLEISCPKKKITDLDFKDLCQVFEKLYKKQM